MLVSHGSRSLACAVMLVATDLSNDDDDDDGCESKKLMLRLSQETSWLMYFDFEI